MSAIKVPNVGERTLLDAALGGLSLTYRLYQNAHTPGDGSTAADFTECTFDGYAAQGPSWGAAATNGSGDAEAVAAALTWTATGGSTSNTVYGYYVTDGGGEVVWAELFDTPVAVVDAPDAVVVTPTITLKSQS